MNNEKAEKEADEYFAKKARTLRKIGKTTMKEEPMWYQRLAWSAIWFALCSFASFLPMFPPWWACGLGGVVVGWVGLIMVV